MENIEILDDEDELICHVSMPRAEEEGVEGEELEEEGAAEPEVITARSDEDEE